MPLSDTSPTAAAAQLNLYRAMSGEQRVLLAFEMSLAVRELNRAGIRRDHPDWTELEVTRELLRIAFQPNLLPEALR